MLRSISMIILFLSGVTVHAQTVQGVAINNTGIPPDTSAMLDITATDKGILIPRTDTLSILNPAQGLLIYMPSDSAFWYFDGVKWRLVGEASVGPPGPSGPTGPTAFDPDHCDGLDSAIGVHITITDTSPYIVPPGKNLHALITVDNSIGGGYIVNSTSFGSFSWGKIILPAGAQISTTVSNTNVVFINGYTVPAIYQPVFFDLAFGPYTVPPGKVLYLMEVLSGSPPFTTITIDGTPLQWAGINQEKSFGPYFIVNGGSIIAKPPPSTSPEVINGFLR